MIGEQYQFFLPQIEKLVTIADLIPNELFFPSLTGLKILEVWALHGFRARRGARVQQILDEIVTDQSTRSASA